VADPEGLSRGRRIHGERGIASLNGVWGWGPGQSPWSGGQGAKPPEADDMLAIE